MPPYPSFDSLLIQTPHFSFFSRYFKRKPSLVFHQFSTWKSTIISSPIACASQVFFEWKVDLWVLYDETLYNRIFMKGITRRLLKVALQTAATKREMRYLDLKRIDRDVRRHFHDDDMVVVTYSDPLRWKRYSLYCGHLGRYSC